jgi:hypothetical protein
MTTVTTNIAATPAELKQLAKALSEFSRELDAYIKASTNPYTPEMQQLRALDTEISVDAADISTMAVTLEAPGVLQAIGDLKEQVGKAQQVLKDIDHVKKALSVVASVLTAAAAIVTGNPLAAAPAVLSLVDAIKGAITANS